MQKRLSSCMAHRRFGAKRPIQTISSEPGLRGELLASGAERPWLRPGSQAVWSEATEKLGLAKILVLENVRRGPDQAEAHQFLAGIARRKGIAVQHHHFMRNAMGVIMDYLVNPGLPHGLSRAEQIGRTVGTSRMWTRLAPAFHLWVLRMPAN